MLSGGISSFSLWVSEAVSVKGTGKLQLPAGQLAILKEGILAYELEAKQEDWSLDDVTFIPSLFFSPRSWKFTASHFCPELRFSPQQIVLCTILDMSASLFSVSGHRGCILLTSRDEAVLEYSSPVPLPYPLPFSLCPLMQHGSGHCAPAAASFLTLCLCGYCSFYGVLLTAFPVKSCHAI